MRKDYLRLFVNFCRKHCIWFDVVGDGTLGDMTIMDGDDSYDYYTGHEIKFGSKEAYEWLLANYKDFKEEKNILLERN